MNPHSVNLTDIEIWHLKHDQFKMVEWSRMYEKYHYLTKVISQVLTFNFMSN